jgi:hypothetical protein
VLADTLVRVSHLAMHLEGHLAELDIKPLMVLPSGQGVKAVDALVVFRGTRHVCLRTHFTLSAFGCILMTAACSATYRRA